LSDVQAVSVSALDGIGTDARLQAPTWEQCAQGSDLDNVREGSSKEWNERSLSFAVDVLNIIPVQPSIGLQWETVFKFLSLFTSPKNINFETTHMYHGAITNMDIKSLYVSNIVGSEYCIASNDGQKVHDKVVTSLSRKRKIHLSFENITIVSSAFLYSAIGQLYDGKFSDKDIEENLKITGLSSDHDFLLNRIKQRAKEYYKCPEKFERAANMES
jgi:hypothetical protein